MLKSVGEHERYYFHLRKKYLWLIPLPAYYVLIAHNMHLVTQAYTPGESFAWVSIIFWLVAAVIPFLVLFKNEWEDD